MTLKLGATTASAAANAAIGLLDLGANPSTLVVYDGAEPATAGTALAAQVALVSFELPRPAFAAALDTVDSAFCDANPITNVLAIESGTASFFRMIDGDGVVILQGSVSDGSGTGDLKISSTSVLTGVEVSVLSLDYSQPKF